LDWAKFWANFSQTHLVTLRRTLALGSFLVFGGSFLFSDAPKLLGEKVLTHFAPKSVKVE
jgi:hypothetical protein